MALNNKWLLPFTDSQVDISALNTSQIKLLPRQSLSQNSKIFNFDVPVLGEYYADLSKLKIYVKGSVCESDGTKLTADEKVAVCNNFLNSLFEKVEVSIGHNQNSLSQNITHFILH